MSALVADRGDKPTFERGHDDPEPLLCPPYGLGKAVGARGAWNTAARTHDARLLHHLLDIGVCKLPDEAHIGGEIPEPGQIALIPCVASRIRSRFSRPLRLSIMPMSRSSPSGFTGQTSAFST